MDRRVQAAFEAVDDAIAGDESGPLLSRLAHAWLPQMLASLREIIRRNRRDGAVFSTVGRGDATIALNIYLRTQRSVSDLPPRRMIERRVRLGRRASILAGRSLLLLVTYSDKTETLMYVHALERWQSALTCSLKEGTPTLQMRPSRR
jgi:hypothetical protein